MFERKMMNLLLIQVGREKKVNYDECYCSFSYWCVRLNTHGKQTISETNSCVYDVIRCYSSSSEATSFIRNVRKVDAN